MRAPDASIELHISNQLGDSADVNLSTTDASVIQWRNHPKCPCGLHMRPYEMEHCFFFLFFNGFKNVPGISPCFETTIIGKKMTATCRYILGFLYCITHVIYLHI